MKTTKTLALLTAPFLALSPLSAQDGPREATDMMDLFERMHRQGASDEDVRRFLDDNVRKELMLPHLKEGTLRIERSESLQPNRPLIGVIVRPVDDILRSHLQLPDDAGVLVEEVREDSPAKEAGILKDDIIVSVDGVGVKDHLQIIRAVETAGKENRDVRLDVIQKGERKTLSVPVKMPEPPAPPEPEAREKAKGEAKKEKRDARPGPAIQRMQRRLNDQQRQIHQLRREIENLKRESRGPASGESGE